MNTATSKQSTKAGSMSSLLAVKGAASPSGDVKPRGEEPAVQPPSSKPSAPVGASSSSELASMLASLNSPVAESPLQLPKVTINVKLDQAVEQKLKQIVGFEKMKRSSNFSQQDWLESRINALVELEHAKLPKF